MTVRHVMASALALILAACGGDDSATGPDAPPGECSPTAAVEQVWAFDDGYDGWTADSLTTDPYNTVRWEGGHVMLRGRGTLEGTPDAWMSRTVTLANSCDLTLSYVRDGHGLSTGHLRIRFESGGTSHLVQDWVTITGSTSESQRAADLSDWAGRSGTLIFEWEDEEDAGGEQDPGIVFIEEIAIR